MSGPKHIQKKLLIEKDSPSSYYSRQKDLKGLISVVDWIVREELFVKRSITMALVLTVFCATTALAAPCGRFVDSKSGGSLVFNSDGTTREYDRDGQLSSLNNYYRAGSALYLRNLESGWGNNYNVSANGKNLTLKDPTWGDKIFAGTQPLQCKPKAEFAYLAKPVCDYGKERECCSAGDMGACVKDAELNGDLVKLKQFCGTRPDACLALQAAYEKEANKGGTLFSMYAEKKPLAPEQLKDVAEQCKKHTSPELCRKSMEQLWRGNHFTQARDLLKSMCATSQDGKPCERYEQLSSIQLPAKIEAASALPCGEYTSTVSSLTGDITFLDKGAVQLGLGSRLRARLEDGLVKVRHDKGGDFIFARIGQDILLGMDDWNRLEVYRRNVVPEKACQAPVVYTEVPLSSGCGIDKDPNECCKAGDTQGCNRLGSMAALTNNWQKAAEQYAKVCAQGVRVGCENWVYTIGKTGDSEGVAAGLTTLCDRNSSHVACDILETGSIQKMMLGYGLEQMLKESGSAQ
jgi:hypothetical protein